MTSYLNLLDKILQQGVLREDRTGTGTLSLFGHQMRFDLSQSFPLLTTKKVHLHSVIHELLWMLSGDTNIQYLKDHRVRIWNEWADDKGNLGPVYGAQWRSWKKPNGEILDQISHTIHQIKTHPYSRRHLVVAFNPGELDEMALPPCHAFFQFYVSENRLSCQMYQRSADVFLGLPFNIASYSLLTMMMAQVCGLQFGEYIQTIGDAHLYMNHISQAKLQLTRQPKPLPSMQIEKQKSIFDYRIEHFKLLNYDYHPRIPAEVSV